MTSVGMQSIQTYVAIPEHCTVLQYNIMVLMLCHGYKEPATAQKHQLSTPNTCIRQATYIAVAIDIGHNLIHFLEFF